MMGTGIYFFICFAVAIYLILKAVEEQGKKTRQLIRGQAADLLYQEKLRSLDSWERELYAKGADWKAAHLEAALARISECRKEAEAERRDAWDIEQRGLHMQQHLGLDELSTLALDIARLETLADWHTAGRSILRDVPVKDYNCEGGWDITLEEWGNEISDRQKRIRREIEFLSSRKRAKRLEDAGKKAVAARAFYMAKSIVLPDGSKGKLPTWIVGYGRA
jgi:hypothetical protein